MKKVLFVSIAFPPKNDPECLQAARYLKYMVKSNLSIEVVTSAIPTLYMPYDKSMEEYNFSQVRKIEVPIFESKISNFILRKISPIGINFPDSKYSFHLQWRRVLEQITSRPDIIYSRSNPVSSALMAFKINKGYNVPWVMHLSDPWVDSPVIRYRPNERVFNQKWEKLCFDTASAVTFTTKETMDFYQEKYPLCRGKFFLSRNVYDPELINSTISRIEGRMTILYTGGLAGGRSPEFFLEACRRVVAKDPRFAQTDIVFAGPIDKKNKRILNACGLTFVRHIGNVSYENALKLQRSAHILLTIDEPLSETSMGMFFPSKILDYFMARRPILALTNRGSATSRILTSCNETVVHYPAMDLIMKFLMEALAAFHARDVRFFMRDKIPAQFSAEQNTQNLVSLFQSL